MRKLFLALAPLVVLILLVEGALWLAGVGDPSLDLSRGFDEGAQYLVPDPEVEGGWLTRIHGTPGRRAQVLGTSKQGQQIPPKGDQLRLLMFGGSNTESFPHRTLEKDLRQRTGDDRWEVINLGRSGYGSGRVAIVVEQSMVLEPDVLVIYSGHNEFVEKTFADELESRWGSGWTRSLARAAGNLRLFNLLTGALQSDTEAAGEDKAPSPLDRQGVDRNDLTFEDTLAFYGNYRDNLVRMCRAGKAVGAEVVLCTLVSNGIFPPRGTSASPGLDEEQLLELRGLALEAARAIPARFYDGVIGGYRVGLADWFRRGWGGEDVERPDRPEGVDPELAARLVEAMPTLRPLGGPLANLAETRGRTASIEGSHWPDPSGWVTEVGTTLTSYEQFCARDLTDAERTGLLQARDLLDEALAIDPEHPGVLFASGTVLWLLGDDDAEALARLGAAQHFDRAPKSANDIINGIVREVAAEEGVTLLDADTLYRQRTSDGLIGYELMMDACHLHPGARFPLMDDMAQAVIAARD